MSEKDKPAAAEPKREDVKTERQQQHTGNHEGQKGGGDSSYGADTYGGTRSGAENVEPGSKH